MDFEKSADEVAGFIFSRESSSASIQDEYAALLKAITSAGAGNLQVRVSGVQGKSHDHYDMINGTTIDLASGTGLQVSTARDKVIAAMLGKKVSELSNLPASFGASHTSLVLRSWCSTAPPAKRS
jgi:hypothetical protein